MIILYLQTLLFHCDGDSFNLECIKEYSLIAAAGSMSRINSSLGIMISCFKLLHLVDKISIIEEVKKGIDDRNFIGLVAMSDTSLFSNPIEIALDVLGLF